MKRLLKPIWIFLAILFLVEAWLWDRLGPVVASFTHFSLWRRISGWMETRIPRLSPSLTLCVFALPVLTLFPFKIGALWLLAHGQFLLGMAIILLAKLVGVGLFAWLFQLCRPKLLMLHWFARFYNTLLRWRIKAHELLQPYQAIIQRYRTSIQRRNPFMKRAIRMRNQVKAKHKPML